MTGMADDQLDLGARASFPLLILAGWLTCCTAAPEATPEPWEAAARTAQQAYRSQELSNAEAGFREALRLAETTASEAGRRHSIEGLAATLAGAGRLDAADSLYSILLNLQRHRFEADSLSGMAVVRTLGSLGEINLRGGDVDRADSFFTSIMDLRHSGQVDLRAEEPALAYTIHGLGEVLAARGQTAAADSLRGRAMGLQLYAQGFSLYLGEDVVRAEETWRRALDQQERLLGAGHADLARTAYALGGLLELLGRRNDAIEQYRRAAHVYATTGDSPIDEARVLDDLARLLQMQQPAYSDSLRQRASLIRRELDS